MPSVTVEVPSAGRKDAPPTSKQVRTQKPSVKTSVKKEQSSSGSDASDISSDLEVTDEESPLPAHRPEDPEGAVRYDTLKAVWWPRNKQPSASTIRKSMTSFSDLIKGVRDTWKSRSEALKAAENQNLEDKIPVIKKDVIGQRRLLQIMVTVSLESGHPAFIRRYVLSSFLKCLHFEPFNLCFKYRLSIRMKFFYQSSRYKMRTNGTWLSCQS